jgi:RNA polymerase sigma factor (sigma-70 family)
MPSSSDSPNTADILHWVSELQAGRPDAAEAEFRKIVALVEKRAKAAFERFPRVGRFEDVDDVVQNTLIRLLAAFRELRPASRQHFYALSNTLIRRELLDLTRRYYGPQGHGANLSPVAVGEASGEFTPPAKAEADLEHWVLLHQAIEKLPTDQREAFSLTFYHGWPQAAVADLFQVTVRTVQRWIAEAIDRLRASGAWK